MLMDDLHVKMHVPGLRDVRYMYLQQQLQHCTTGAKMNHRRTIYACITVKWQFLMCDIIDVLTVRLQCAYWP